jgi:hypothetical protein
VIQLLILLLIISYLFGNIAEIGAPGMFIYGGYVYLSVYAMTELMDKNPIAWLWEILKSSFGILVILTTGDWFGLSENIPGLLPVLIVYFVISAGASTWFSIKENKLVIAHN